MHDGQLSPTTHTQLVMMKKKKMSINGHHIENIHTHTQCQQNN